MTDRKIKVLLVEDQSYIREVMSLILAEYSSLDLTAVNRGDLAVNLMLTEGDFDLILMDIRLPRMSGIEATRRIRRFSSVPIWAVSAYGGSKTRGEARAAGIERWYQKPVDHQQLVIDITRWMQNRPRPVEMDEEKRKIITIWRTRLHKLRERQALKGSDAPVDIEIEIEQLERRIEHELSGE